MTFRRRFSRTSRTSHSDCPSPSRFRRRCLRRRPPLAGGTIVFSLSRSSLLGSMVSTLQQSVDLLDSYMDDLLAGRVLVSSEPSPSTPRVVDAILDWLERHWSTLDLALPETPVEDAAQLLDFFRRHDAFPPLDAVAAFCGRFGDLSPSAPRSCLRPPPGTPLPRGTLRGAAGGDAAVSRQPARAFGGTSPRGRAAQQAASRPLFYRGCATPPRRAQTAGRRTHRPLPFPRGSTTSPRSRDLPRGT